PGETSCNATKMIKKGCYYDPRYSERLLPNLLRKYREGIDWNEGWDDFLQNVTCQ
ncbi:Hypothetical predicted protein, partial [Paramuricea clavata]